MSNTVVAAPRAKRSAYNKEWSEKNKERRKLYFEQYNSKRRKRVTPKSQQTEPPKTYLFVSASALTIAPEATSSFVTASITASFEATGSAIYYVSGSVTCSVAYSFPTRKQRSDTTNTSKLYWTQANSAAVVAFNSSTCPDDRNRIFDTYLHQPMSKIVECVFNTFKFSYFETGPEDVQKECLTHLVANIHKFDPTRVSRTGAKANPFSYFSVIAKHYLILLNNSNYKRFTHTDEILEDHDENGHNVPEQLRTESPINKLPHGELLKYITDYFDERIQFIFRSDNERLIASSVVEILRNAQRIEVFNKKALYLYIREMAMSKTQKITKVVTVMRKYVEAITELYLNHGHVNFEDVTVETLPADKWKRKSKQKTTKSEFVKVCRCCGKKLFYGTKGALEHSLRNANRCRYCKGVA